MDNFGDASIPGASADQQKVLAVVKNNDTEEGADIASDFAHLGSKFLARIQNNSHSFLLEIANKSAFVFTSIFNGQRQTSRNSELVER